MQLLQSDWLIQMLKKSASTPKARILNLFSILDDWIDAPNMRELCERQGDAKQNQLQIYLASEAAKSGAEMPELLANQLYFMAVAATQEKLQHNRSDSLVLAKAAAEAMITSQTKSDFHIPKKTVYASAASLLIVFAVGGLLYKNAATIFPPSTSPSVAMVNQSAIIPAQMNTNKTASPTQTAALFARVKKMRTGNCRLLEAIQLPDKYKTVYFENIIQGQISTDLGDQRIVNELLNKVRCNYSPMLMKNSRG